MICLKWSLISEFSLRQVPVMPPSVLRTLPFGTAVLLLRHARPAVVDLQAWVTAAEASCGEHPAPVVHRADSTPRWWTTQTTQPSGAGHGD